MGGGGANMKIPPVILPPQYGFQSNFMNDWLPQLVGQTAPQFQGSVDPGQSPTTQAWINSSQQFATSPQQYLAGAEGVLGNVLGGQSGGPSSYGPTPSDYSLNRFMFPGGGAGGPLAPQPRDTGYGYGSHAGTGPGGGLFSPPSPSPGPPMGGPGGGPSGGYPGGGGPMTMGQSATASTPTNDLAWADRGGENAGPPGTQPGAGGGQPGSQNFRFWNHLPVSDNSVAVGMPYIPTSPWGSNTQKAYPQMQGHRGFTDWNPGAGVLPIQGRDVGNFAQPSRGWNYQNPLGNQGGGGGGGGGGGQPGPGPGGSPPGDAGPGAPGGGGPGGGRPTLPGGPGDDFDPTGGSGGYPGGGKVPMPSTAPPPGGSTSNLSSLSPQMQAIMRSNSGIANQFGFGSPGQQQAGGGMQTQSSQLTAPQIQTADKFSAPTSGISKLTGQPVGAPQGGMSNMMLTQQGDPGRLQSMFQQLQQQGGANLSGAFGGASAKLGSLFTGSGGYENMGGYDPNRDGWNTGFNGGNLSEAERQAMKPGNSAAWSQMLQNAFPGGGGAQGGGFMGGQSMQNAQRTGGGALAQGGLQTMGQGASSPLTPGTPRDPNSPGDRGGPGPGPGTPRPEVPPQGPFGRDMQVPPLPQWQPANGTTDFQGFYDAAQNRVKNDIRTGVEEQLSRAGLSGNRFSSGAEQRVANVVGDAYGKLGEQFAGISYQHGRDDAQRGFQGNQNELQRALQATGMGQQADQFFAQLASQNRRGDLDRQMMGVNTMLDMQRLQDAGMKDRLGALGTAGGAEQGRADQFNQLSYNDFLQGRWGSLPMLQGFLGGGGGGPAQPNPIMQEKGPSGWDYALQAAGAAAALGMAFSDERLKADVRPLGRVGPVEFKSWRWKHSGEPGAGVMAQQIERLDPAAVRTDPFSGIKMVDKARTFDLILDGLRAESTKRRAA
jgi:hypothetical protein